MQTRWGRTSAAIRLIVAIFSDLRRRAWWSYRKGTFDYMPRTTIVAPQPPQQQPYVPRITSDWRSVAAHALTINAITSTDEFGDHMSVVWIDVGERPDVTDLPRVIEHEYTVHQRLPVAGTQWLADHHGQYVILVVAFIEPVDCTFAIRFELPQSIATLDQIADSGDLFVAWNIASDEGVVTPHTTNGLLLRSSRPGQLRTILISQNRSSNID